MRRLALPTLVFLCHAVQPAGSALAAEGPDTTTQPRNTVAEQSPSETSAWPKWLKFGVLERNRMEAPFGVGFKKGADQLYDLNRVRLDVTLKPESWLQFVVQGQDTRAFAYKGPAGSMQDPVDLRQAYVQVGDGERSGYMARVGRQEMNYAGGWLISPSDWGNTGRTVDGAVVSYKKTGLKLDVLTASAMLPDPNRFDRHRPGDRMSGAYGWLDKLVPRASIEPFLFYRTQLNVVSELGHHGEADSFNGGVRMVGRLPGRFDYSTLIVSQWGSYAGDGISGLGGAHSIGWTLNSSSWKPRISAEYDHASGDHGSKDGSRETFDQCYGGYHYQLGIADRLGWRNSRNRRVGFEFTPLAKLKVVTDVRDLSLATVADSLYDASGAKSVSNPKATSTHVGVELDSYAAFQLTNTASIGGGIGHLFPGAYLLQSGKGGYTFPYLMVTKKF
ncbi:MAG TPA: alginate export family protein [Bryobacteraceae bacterium]|nr:alginate export family protein [Bryobacteraceae bacterium]